MVTLEALGGHAPYRAHPPLHRHGLPACAAGALPGLRAGNAAVPEPRPADVSVRADRARPAGPAGTQRADLARTVLAPADPAAHDRLRGGEGPDELDRAAGPA